jgi:hypothetical protein
VLLPQNIMELVGLYGARIGVAKLAPHDLRRYAVCRTMPRFVCRDAPTGVGVVMNSA